MRFNHQPSLRTIAQKGNQHLSIEFIGDLLKPNDGTPENSHVHQHTEIFWMIRGAGKLYLDMQVFELEINNFYIIQPGQVHKIQCSHDTTGYIISVSQTLFENATMDITSGIQHNMLILMPENREIYLDPTLVSDIQDIIERMIKETTSDQEYSDEILFRYFKIFLFYLQKQFSNRISKTIQSRNIQITMQFKDLVEKHYKTKKGVCEYASELNLTPNYLNEIIKKVTGNTAGYLIRQRIVLEAKRFAIHSGVCMKEIGYHLGFSDMAHFSKFFKSVSGGNFTDFKNDKSELAIIR
jgi:AraC family transcriptional activator of pobA